MEIYLINEEKKKKEISFKHSNLKLIPENFLFLDFDLH